MSISKILADKNTTSEDKLDAVAAIVASARKAYGNASEEVKSPDVQTPYGMTSFETLLDDSKVALLSNEVQNVRAAAVEFARHQEGANINKKIEELIATNGMFCNIVNKSDMSYV